MEINEDIFSVVSRYDTLFIDMYGVLFDGSELYNGTLATMSKLKAMGKKIVLLSNTSQLSADARRGYTERGMRCGTHYDHFVTSGEFLHNILLHHSDVLEEHIGKKFSAVKCLFIGNSNIFDGTKISQAPTYEEADLIYIAPPRAHYGSVRVDNLYDETDKKIDMEDFLDHDWTKLKDPQGRQGLAEFAFQLKKFSKAGKTLFLSNPDIFAHCGIDDGKYPIVMQGAIARYYEKFFKGKAIYFGKPFAGIYDFAKKISSSENDKILMVGDTLWTDVLGAYNAGIDSALVMTGISGEFFRKMRGKALDEKLKILSERIGMKLSCSKQNLKNPTYMLRHFYGDLI